MLPVVVAQTRRCKWGQLGSHRARLRQLTVGGFLEPFEIPLVGRLFVSPSGARFKGSRGGAAQSLPSTLQDRARRAAGPNRWSHCLPAVGVVDRAEGWSWTTRPPARPPPGGFQLADLPPH